MTDDETLAALFASLDEFDRLLLADALESIDPDEPSAALRASLLARALRAGDAARERHDATDTFSGVTRHAR